MKELYHKIASHYRVKKIMLKISYVTQNFMPASLLFQMIFTGRVEAACLKDTLNWTQHCARRDYISLANVKRHLNSHQNNRQDYQVIRVIYDCITRH
jgi:hypothetical protein